MSVPLELSTQHMILIVGDFNFDQVLPENVLGLIQAAFYISMSILCTLIWVCPNLILGKAETTIEYNLSFFIKSAT